MVPLEAGYDRSAFCAPRAGVRPDANDDRLTAPASLRAVLLGKAGLAPDKRSHDRCATSGPAGPAFLTRWRRNRDAMAAPYQSATPHNLDLDGASGIDPQ
jgi:hypothetical protein